MKNRWLSLIFVVAMRLAVKPAAAQVVPPFFGGGSVAFDPEISVIQSGVLLDAQATVSADKKYVTLNMRPTASRLQSLQPFPVNAIVNQGFVGGANLSANAAPAGGRNVNAVVNGVSNPSPDQLSRNARAWVFTRQGMYLVAPLP